jgi:hypothetical protein
MTREEGKEFANALKNNYTIDFDKIPDFCDLVISALEKNESAEEWYKLLCEKWDSAENCFNGMTNGEVIQALFPNVKKYESTEYHNILFAPSCHLECCNEDWWNTPYQKEGE